MKYKEGTIERRPNIPVSNPTESHYLKFGWKSFINDRPQYNPETHRLERGDITETETEAIQGWNVVELTELEILQRQVISEQDIRIEKLERKLERLADSGDTATIRENEIPYGEGVQVRTGEILVDEGERYMMRIGGTLVMREDLRPSVLYEQQGNRTVWQHIPADIPEEDLCSEAPEWNGANWNDYGVGYKVKANNAIWEAINTTHTWIEPSVEGDGAISWTHVKDCT